MDKFLAALIFVILISVVSFSLRVGGFLAGVVPYVWFHYRGRFPMTTLLEESPEATEDVIPALGCFMLLAGGVLFGLGKFWDLRLIAQLGAVLAFLPIAGFALRVAVNPSSMSKDTGLTLLQRKVPRIQRLTERLNKDSQQGQLLQSYRHAWRAQLLSDLLLLEDSKIGFSAQSLQDYAQFKTQVDVRKMIDDDIDAIGDPADDYLTHAITRVRIALKRHPAIES